MYVCMYVCIYTHIHISVVPRVFLGIPVYISNVYFSETKGTPSWLGAMPEKFLEFGASRLA